MKISLPIKLTPKQQELDDCKARFIVVKAGRRSGKTFYMGYWLAKRALTVRGKHWYVCQNLDLIRDEMWPHLCDLLRDYIVWKDDRLFRMRISNGVFESIIVCKSAEREDGLRGRGLSSLALDEASFVRPRLWDVILRPMLLDKKAPALICSSAKKGWFSNTYNYAAKAKDDGWAAFHFTIYDNPEIEHAEIEATKRSTPMDVWKQEYMGEEISHQGQVYAEYKDSVIFDPSKKFQGAPSWPVVVGMDWGTQANAAAVWVHISPEGYLVATREHVRNNWDVGRHASVIKGFCSTISSSVREFVLDRSAFRRESSGQSIADQYRKFGIYCQQSEKDLQSSINLVKQFLRGDGQKPWLYISAECQLLLASIQEWEWDAHEPDDLVALRYAVTHIVRRGLTPLANKFPEIVHPEDRSDELEVAAIIDKMRSPYKINTSIKKSFTWDGDTGVPY